MVGIRRRKMTISGAFGKNIQLETFYLGEWMKKLILGFCLIIGLSTQAFQLTTDQKLADLQQLVSVMKAGYGPLEYKKNELGIDIDVLTTKYAELIKQTKTNGEFYYLIVQFVAEFRDGHFAASVPTKHAARVGFSVNWVNGKVYIDSINRKQLKEDKFPFEKGDEILSINGQDTQAFLDDFVKYVGNGYKQTERATAAYYLVSRSGRRMPVPAKDSKVTYTIRRGTSDIVESVELPWIHSGTPGDEHAEFETKGLNPTREMDMDDLSMFDIVDEFVDPGFHCSGGTRIDIPKDATVIMKEPFVAYYHPTKKGNIGYLRIPHYSPKNNEYELRFAQYQFAVNKLEEKTVGLVIDQDHNCGGSVSYLHQLLSLFIEKPVSPMLFRLLGTKTEYSRYASYLESANPFTLEYQRVKKVAELMRAAWLRGDFLTEMTPISGNDTVYPNSIRYTKPVLMLIDFWSGSGGDAFPSLMQGYGRAKLFGTRTMGLGGHVGQMPALNYSGINIAYTKSLFFRPDGVAVENNGAEPDVPYTITRDDFMYGFKNYQKAYLKTLMEML